MTFVVGSLYLKETNHAQIWDEVDDTDTSSEEVEANISELFRKQSARG